MSDAENFLRALWEKKPTAPAIQLWRKSDKKSFYYSRLDSAVDWISGNSESDIYMAAGLAPKQQPPNKQRATKLTVVGIPGVWADIDVNGGPDGKTGVARNLEQAEELAESLLAPTVLVHSGYGIQAWWLFEEPWLFANEEEREKAQRIVTGFQGALRAEAKKLGFTIDSTFDISRLMRVPGGYNHKGVEPQLVELRDDGGERFAVDAVEAVGADYQRTVTNTHQLLNGEGVEFTYNPDAQPPFDLWTLVMQEHDEFRLSWERKTKGIKKDDPSSWDFSLTNHMVRLGWKDQEIVDTLTAHRRTNFPGKDKQNPEYYYRTTIGKVRATVGHQEEVERGESDREEATEQIAALGDNAGLNPELTIGLFNRVVGGPKIKNLVQYGTDPDSARYVLLMANGDEIPFAAIGEITNLPKFRDSFATKTRHLCKNVKPEKWLEVCQSLLNTTQVIEDQDDTRAIRSLTKTLEYTRARKSFDKDAAIPLLDPFEHDEYLWIAPGPFSDYLRRQKMEKVTEADAKQILIAAGFEKRQVGYNNPKTNKWTTCQRYYRISTSLIGEENGQSSA